MEREGNRERWGKDGETGWGKDGETGRRDGEMKGGGTEYILFQYTSVHVYERSAMEPLHTLFVMLYVRQHGKRNEVSR